MRNTKRLFGIILLILPFFWGLMFFVNRFGLTETLLGLLLIILCLTSTFIGMKLLLENYD